MKERQYYATGVNAPHAVRSTFLVSSVRVVETPAHWRISVWNRGGKSGELVVNASDGPKFLDMFLPPDIRYEAEIRAGDV
jgi:hypothetical protein